MAASSKSGTKGLPMTLNVKVSIGIAAVAILFLLILSEPPSDIGVPPPPFSKGSARTPGGVAEAAQAAQAAVEKAAASAAVYAAHATDSASEAMAHMDTTKAEAVRRVRQSFEWQKKAVQKHFNVKVAGEFISAFRTYVTQKCLDDNGEVSMQVLGLLVIVCSVGLDLFYSWACSPVHPAPVPCGQLELYRTKSAQALQEAAAHKTATHEAFEHALEELNKIPVEDLETREAAVTNAQEAQNQEEAAEKEVDTAMDKVTRVEMVAARWESFAEWHHKAKQDWQTALDFSLQQDGENMDRTDLRNFLNAPENKWRFAGKQHTKAELDNLFEAMDANHDGVISQDEFMDHFLSEIEN